MEKGNVNSFIDKLKIMSLEVREDWLPTRTRTTDPVVNSHLLYQLSYWGVSW